MVKIGDIDVPLPLSESLAQSRDTTQFQTTDSVPTIAEFEAQLEQGEMPFVLHQDTHANNESLGEQIDAIQSLADRDSQYNSFNFLDHKGHLAIDSVSVSRDPRLNLREGSFTFRYLPDTLYQPGVSTNESQVSNDFNIRYYGTFPLPSSVTDVRLRNGITGDSVPLSPITSRVNESSNEIVADLGSEDGNWNLYRTSRYIDSQTAGTTSGTQVKDTGATSLEVHRLDTGGETLEETVEYPNGDVNIIVRAKAGSDGDSITVNGTSKSFGTSFETVSETVTVSGSELTVTLAHDSGQVDIDYALVVSAERPQVLFNYPDSDYTVGTDQSVRVWDDNDSSTPGDWTRVYDRGHSFQGTPVVENGVVRIVTNDSGDSDYLKLYWYDGSSYTSIGRFGIYDGTTSYYSPTNIYVDSISPGKCVISLDFDSSSYTITLEEGTYSAEVTGMGATSFRFLPGTDYSITDESPGDKNQNDTVSISSENQSFVSGFSTANDTIPFSVKATTTGTTEITLNGNYRFSGLDSSTEYTFWVGAVSFDVTSNLYTEGEAAGTRNSAWDNHWETYLASSGALSEFSGDTGGFTEDTANTLITHSADSWDAIYLNALQFGTSESTNHYRLTTEASDTTDSEIARMMIASQDTTRGQSEYYAELDYSTDTVTISVQDSGGTQTSSSNASMTLSYATVYHAEVEFDPANDTIDLYVWQDGNGKPSSATVSHTDSTYDNGNIGYAAYGSVDMHSFEANAEETSSSGNSANIVPHESIASTQQTSHDNTVGTNFPLGSYVTVYRVKNTDSSTSIGTVYTQNATDATTLNINGAETISPGTSYEYITQATIVDANDEGDTLEVRLDNDAGSGNYGHVAVDEIMVFPMALFPSGDVPGPQDLARANMEDPNIDRELLHRRQL